MEKEVTVKDWISYDEASGKDVSIGGIGGFFKEGMRWEDYFDDLKDEVKPYALAIRDAVVKGGIKLTGEQHQLSSNGVPLFSDDTTGQFSYRAWGDIMAAIWSTAENRDSHYMEFYM